jgi:hypothetical protein
VEQSKVELNPELLGDVLLTPFAPCITPRGTMFPDAPKAPESARAVIEISPENFTDVSKYSVRIKVQTDAVYMFLGLDRINTEHLQHNTGQISYGWSTDDHLMTVTCDLDSYIVVTREALTGKVLQTAEYSYEHKQLQALIGAKTPEGGFVFTDQPGGNIVRREPKVRKPIPAFKLSQYPGISHK